LCAKTGKKKKKEKEKEKEKEKKICLYRVPAASSFAPPIHFPCSFHMIIIFVYFLCFKKVGCAHRASCVMLRSL